MVQANIQVRGATDVVPLIWIDLDRAEILKVLERAAEDDDFIAQMTHSGVDALRGYELTLEAQAALLSGDIRWIEARVGKLDERLRTWLDCRLQQEIW
jgi:hypothetical protein